jgi:tetratricopeptide (TPR) repeat protein
MIHILTSGALSLLLASDPAALFQRAYQMQQAGDYAHAADAYIEFLKVRPDEVAALSNLGVVLVKLGRYDEAIAEYEAAEKILPNEPRIGLNLALAYSKSGRLTEAAAKLEALPRDNQVALLLADTRLRMGENQRVIDLLKPLENSSDLAVAYMLGMALLREKRAAEGQALLDRILSKGDSAEARFLLGVGMFESGDYPAAIQKLKSAIDLNPRLPELESYYGQALLLTGDADAASDAFRKELENNPTDYRANLGLGQILEARKHFAESRPFLDRAKLIRPLAAEPRTPGKTRQPGGPAPNFALPEAGSGKIVALRSYKGKTPVVLVFGSYSCPNFRAAAPALEALHAKYGPRIPFLLVYIREAHTGESWESDRNAREGVKMTEAATLAQKKGHAAMCSRALHLGFPALVDRMDGAVEKAYAAWPSRAVVVGITGQMLYNSGLTELDFHPEEMEAALKSSLQAKHAIE